MTAPIAVAVVSWNTRELLDACLRSLRADADAGLAEVWVADNASSDGSPELVAERHPWARLVETGGNLGFGPAVNRVAQCSVSPWLVAANSDIEVERGALATLLATGERDARTGAIGPRLILPDGSTQPSVQPFPTIGDASVRALHLHRLSARVAEGRYLRERWDPERPAVVPWVTGAFVMLRRAAFDAVGRFDEGQWMYAEDLDVCWRLARAGWVTRYEPAALVRHHHSVAAKEAFGEGLEERWLSATWAWIARRRGVGTAWTTAAVRALDPLARLAVLTPLARATPRWEPRRRRALRELRGIRLGLRSRRRLLEFR